MNNTYFTFELVDVANSEGEKVRIELTNYSGIEYLKDDLCESLNCTEKELNLEDAYIDAQEDFLIPLLLEISDGYIKSFDQLENIC